MALIPLGWPRGRFGAGPRRPVEKVTFWERWGQSKERQPFRASSLGGDRAK